MIRPGLRAALLVAMACGRPAPPEPAVPEAVVDGTIDAAVDEEPVPVEDIIDVSPAGPLHMGEPMPALPPPPCDDPAARREDIDVDHDGRPEVRKVFLAAGRAEWLACKLTDIDMDGDFDMATLLDGKGGRLMEYLDLDFDGQVDIATSYDPHSGAVASIAHDLDDDGKVDSVDAPPGASPP